jgi:putative multiple sugar transport system substrate-binding protein
MKFVKNLSKKFRIIAIATLAALVIAIIIIVSLNTGLLNRLGIGSRDGFVGIAMATQDDPRWSYDGQRLEEGLSRVGFTVDLQFAQDDILVQVEQIENMIAAGVDLLIVTPIYENSQSLEIVFAQAYEAGIPVILYGRMLMNSDNISYYVDFDNFLAGQMQGQFIADKLSLENRTVASNIEIFAGPVRDIDSRLFFDGAMDVLRPFLDTGVLVVPSRQIDFISASTADWSTENAMLRMEDIIQESFEGDSTLHAVLSSSDTISLGVVNALEAYYQNDWPIITGYGSELENIRNMIGGLQQMSIFRDSNQLVAQMIDIIDGIITGNHVPADNTTTFDNGAMVVPAHLVPPTLVTYENFREVLIDSGYYTEEELGL